MQSILARTVLLLSLGGWLLSGCDSSPRDKKAAGKSGAKYPDFHYSSADVTGPATPPAARLPVDIYLDATLSMRGFSRPQNTTFSQLLEGIEAAVQNAAKSSDLRYFKYGRSVAPISRQTFVAARHSQALWEDKGFRSDTDFAQAVDSTKADRVSIFITDLFYSNADANKVVAAIENKCFKKGVELGIMGLKSDYDGYVADVQPPVKVTGPRPLYMLVFGSKANINLVFGAFKNQPYVQPDQGLLLTRYPVKSFRVTATKDRQSKAINNNASGRKQFDAANVFAFNWNPAKGAQGTVDYTLDYELEPYALPLPLGASQARIYRRDAGAPDSVADASSLQLLGQQLAPGRLSGQAQATLKDNQAAFTAYQVSWLYDSQGRIELPRWITDNSTADFSTSSSDAAKHKTLALDTFVRSLIANSATQFEPRYGTLYLVFVHK